LKQGELRTQAWQRWRIKDGDKGPMVWEIKHVLFYPKDENGMPGTAHQIESTLDRFERATRAAIALRLSFRSAFLKSFRSSSASPQADTR
jgi:hypothetical protein